MTNMDRFKATYAKQLEQVRRDKPDYYTWTWDQLPIVTARMLDAIEKGSFNKDSLAFKQTCKELGIKHTYKAIRDFTKGE